MNLGKHLARQIQLGTLKNFLFIHNKLWPIKRKFFKVGTCSQLQLNKIRQLHAAYNLNLQGSSGRDGCCAQAAQISKFDLSTAYSMSIPTILANKVADWAIISSKHLVHEHYGDHFTFLLFMTGSQLASQLLHCVRFSHRYCEHGGRLCPPPPRGCSLKFDVGAQP